MQETLWQRQSEEKKEEFTAEARRTRRGKNRIENSAWKTGQSVTGTESEKPLVDENLPVEVDSFDYRTRASCHRGKRVVRNVYLQARRLRKQLVQTL